MPYAEVPSLMAALIGSQNTSATALAILIMTATRTSELLNATWKEVDLQNRVWSIPGERMKAGREHRVPLSAEAVAVLAARKTEHAKPTDWVFAGARAGRPLSNMALLKLLERMGRVEVTAHGFRSSFRDWAAERTNFPREVAEAALAHSLSNKVEAAYRRSDLFDKRRRLMDAWSRYCVSPKAEVVAFPKSVRSD